MAKDMSDFTDWEGNEPATYDCHGTPIYYGDEYYIIDGVRYTRETLDDHYKHRCEEGDV